MAQNVINLASKYEKKVSERFKKGALTESGAGHDYDFTGVKEITIYSVNTVPLVPYNRAGDATTGLSRFGKVADLTDNTQSLTMEMDEGFTYSIDNANEAEQFNIKQASTSLKREIDEVVIPTVDKYRLASWANGRGLSSGYSVTTITGKTLTKANIIDEIFTAHAQMLDNNVSGKVTMYIPELTYIHAKLADVVMGGSQLNGEAVRKGYKGTLDGIDVVTIPSSRWPKLGDPSTGTDINFILKAAGTTVDPFKLKSYKVKKQPVGIDGDVVEGHIMYDSFVLDTKCKGIVVCTK